MSITWAIARIERPLADVIDKAILNIKSYGSQKYKSRADFARAACLALLQNEGITSPESQVTKTNNKKKEGKMEGST